MASLFCFFEINIYQKVERIINYVFAYLVIKPYLAFFCEKKIFQSFLLYSSYIHSSSETEVFFQKVVEALRALSIIDPARFKRVKQHLRIIAFTKWGTNHYFEPLSAFMVDNFSSESYYFAAEIIHEATHGYLISKGFHYTARTSERHEKICVNEQKRFLARVINCQKEWPEEQKKEILNRWNHAMDEMLKSQWWKSHYTWATKWKRFKELFRKQTSKGEIKGDRHF